MKGIEKGSQKQVHDCVDSIVIVFIEYSDD